jgi:hypothetical protein
VNHEWLSEVTMAVAYRIGGTAGLAILKATLVGVFFVIVLAAYRGAAPAAMAIAIVLIAAGTGRQTVTLRPQLWTLIGVATLCRLLVAGPRRWWLVALPALFMAWVNFHGGWIVGAGLLAVWTAAQMVRPQRSRGFAAAVAALSAAGTLINPYGWDMWEFLAGTVRMGRAITEWQPLVTVPVLAWMPWICVVLGTAALASTKPRPPIERVAMVAVLAFAALRVERLAPLCVTAAVVLMSESVIARYPSPGLSFDPLPKRSAAGLIAAVIVLAVVAATISARAASCIPIAGSWAPDRIAGRALAATRDEGRIVTYFDWGEYAIWHVGPRLRVSLDGRRETVYSDALLSAHQELERATPRGIAFLQQLNPEYVWMPSALAPLRDWLAAHGYRIDLQTGQSFVAVRADRPRLPAFSEPVTGCFPGP